MGSNINEIEELKKFIANEIHQKSDAIEVITNLEGALPSPKDRNKRTSERYVFMHKMNVVDSSTGLALDGNCIDLNTHGVCIYSFEGVFELDNIYKINISPSETTPEFSLAARLVRTLKDEKLKTQILGFKFINKSPENEILINKLIAQET